MKKLLLGTASLAMALGLAGMAQAEGYKIGISNTVQGNGWREEMVCAMKAEALASGKVAELNIAHRNTDAAGQLEDIRNLIQAGVNAIVVNPANAEGINSAIKEATDAGIVVVAVDQAVTEPRPISCRTTRKNTPISARNGCSKPWAAKGPWSTCAGPPGQGPTTTATSASSGRWLNFRM